MLARTHVHTCTVCGQYRQETHTTCTHTAYTCKKNTHACRRACRRERAHMQCYTHARKLTHGLLLRLAAIHEVCYYGAAHMYIHTHTPRDVSLLSLFPSIVSESPRGSSRSAKSGQPYFLFWEPLRIRTQWSTTDSCSPPSEVVKLIISPFPSQYLVDSAARAALVPINPRRKRYYEIHTLAISSFPQQSLKRWKQVLETNENESPMGCEKKAERREEKRKY
jgi:hypothetical protein